MKNKSTIVYFGNNYSYAKNLASESTLVDLVSDKGECTEFVLHEGKPLDVARDEIEGDAEFLIFEDKYLDNMFGYVYETMEEIKDIVTSKEDITNIEAEELKNRLNNLDKNTIISKIKEHFERNENARQGEFNFKENQRKSAYISLSERQEYMLSSEEKERVLKQKEQSYVPQVYSRNTFEEFIEFVNDKKEAISILKEQFSKELTQEELARLENGDHEILKNILNDKLNKNGVDYIVTNSFFNNLDERKKMLSKIEENDLDSVELVNLVDRVLKSEMSEHELYSIIAEDFSQDFLKSVSLTDLLGRGKQELLRSYVWKMQKTEKEMKKDSLKDSGRRYELGEEEGYQPHVCIISSKSKNDIDHSGVAMGYAKQSVTKEIMGRLQLNKTVQLFELDSDKPEESKERLRKIIFSERALKDLRHGEKKSEVEIISELLDLLKNQDSKIANHSLRVSNWVSIIMMLSHESKEIPKNIKIPVGEMTEDVMATGLHDVGKRLAVVLRDLFGDKSDKVSFIEELGRNTSSFGKLPADAKSAILNHSNIGADALETLSKSTNGKILNKAKDVARKHHDPYKKKDKEGKIIVNDDSLINMVTLADCLDAIISGRSYNNVNEPMTLEGTIDILLKDMGGCIKIYREYNDERMEIKPGNWFMDENIKFHFDSNAFENSANVKFNPYFMMMTLKFLRQQVVEAEKGKKVHMSFNDETISPEVKEEFKKIQDVSEVYQTGGIRKGFNGQRHLVTSFSGIPMEQNASQNINSRSLEMKPMETIRSFVELVQSNTKDIRQTARRGGDIIRA
ncbi:MAG: hypothetical protein E7314_01275 [Clostridiales bacterium]|nr:hypothetical protein [Clostridiales bacterium]